MDVDLTDEKRFLQETARKFLEQAAPVSALRQAALAGAPPLTREFWTQATGLGFAALLTPEHYGGAGTEQPLLDLVVVAGEMGRQLAPGPLLPVSVVTDALLAAGTPDQQRQYLPGLADGSRLITWAAGEPGEVWEPAQAQTTARRDGREFVLTGHKIAVEAADLADEFLVTARAAEGVAQFLIPRDQPGLEIRLQPRYDLARIFGDLDLREVRVPAEALVGEPGGIGAVLEHQYQLALCLQAAETAALLERIFEETISYLRTRYAFGRTLASYQALKHRIADHKLWLEAALGISTALTHALAAGDPGSARLASAAKAHIGDQAVTIISDCSQLFGGIAQTWEHDMHLYLRRATANKFVYGSPAQHRDRLCRLSGL